MNRRELLKTLPATLVSIPLAGCGADGAGDGESPTSTATDTPASENGDGSPAPGNESPTTTDSGTPTPDREANVQLGEVVSGDQMSMVVKSLTKTDSLGEFQEAGEGNTYAVVRLEVKNTTRDAYADFSSFFQTQLQDSEGYTYSPSLSVSDSAFQGGQLAPGEVARGDVAFEIPVDASGLTLLFDFSAFSFFKFNRVTVDLTSEANQIGDLHQNLNVTVHNIGDEVTNDGVAVTVNTVDFKESLGEFTKAKEGNTFAIVDVTTANNSDETVNFSSLLQMSVKDGTGLSYSYNVSATSQSTQAYQGGEVTPDGQIRGKLAYEVPKDASPLYFIFEFSVLAGGSKTFWQVR